MPNPPIITFQEALEQSRTGKRHLLLGNGFSIALFPDKFTYGRLLDQADFSNIPLARKAFDILGTTDFEAIIMGLKTAAQLLSLYAGDRSSAIQQMRDDAERLKDILVTVIAGNHPENPAKISEAQFYACRQFLANFVAADLGNQAGYVYSLNYDLLLYWTLMHTDPFSGIKLIHDDGFRAPDGDDYENGLISPYVTWDAEFVNSQNIHYLHGALHIFDDGPELQKFCWERSGGTPLIDQIRGSLSEDKFPLFVAEGDTNGKLTKIRHSGYLQRSLKTFTAVTGSLFIFGHSLAPNDEHILKLIEKGKVSKLFISLFGDPGNASNKAIMARGQLMAHSRTTRKPLDVKFFDAASANVWGAA